MLYCYLLFRRQPCRRHCFIMPLRRRAPIAAADTRATRCLCHPLFAATPRHIAAAAYADIFADIDAFAAPAVAAMAALMPAAATII